MIFKRTIFVCLVFASFAGAQTTSPGSRIPRGRSVVTRAIARRGYLGVGIVEVTPERARALKLSDNSGVEVRRVDENSPAAKAGLKENDIILEVNGQKVDDVEQFIRTIGDTAPGGKVGLTLWRDGAKQSVSATVQARAAQPFVFSDDAPLAPAMPSFPDLPNGVWGPLTGIQSPRIGFEGETLTSQLAEYFGVKEGVLVRSVTAKTPAAKAGLKAGDIIMKVNGTPVTSPREISGLSRGNKRELTFTVMRNHREISLNVEIARSLLPVPDREAL